MKEFEFSVILYVDQPESFSDFMTHFKMIENKENIQLNVLDPYAEGQIADACASCEGLTFSYFSLPDVSIAEAYQMGLTYANGKYLNFALASSYFFPEAYMTVSKAFDQYNELNLISAVPYFTDEGTIYDGAYRTKAEKVLINLTHNEDAHKLQLMLQAYFIRREALKDMDFQPELQENALCDFLCRILLKCPEYLYLTNLSYFYTLPVDDTSAQDPVQYLPHWYTESVCSFLIPLLKSAREDFGEVPRFLQVVCYYQIYAKIRCNLFTKDKGILKDKEAVDRFFNAVFEALTFIDNEVIAEPTIIGGMKTARSMMIFLLQGRAKALGKQLCLADINNTLLAYCPSEENKLAQEEVQRSLCVLWNYEDEQLKILTVNYENGEIVIDASTDLTYLFTPDEFDITAICLENGIVTAEFSPEYTEIYSLLKCFGITYAKKQTLCFHLPINGTKKQTFRFYYRFLGHRHQFNLDFSAYNSRIYADGQEAYWMFKKGWMLRPNAIKTEIIIEQCSSSLHIKKELRFCSSLFNEEKFKPIRWKAMMIRLLYWILLPLARKKHIWVTFDKLYKAGDNGEYMFQYIQKNHKDIDMFYIIRKDSPAYPRLSKQWYKHILVFGTLRCQLVSLFAETILATHDNVSGRYNEGKMYAAFEKDLQRGDVICIQHGLTIQEIAQYQNRTVDNTKLYCCASKYEIQNISQPIYGYKREQLKLTGLARYDGLTNRDQKVILIAPTWRRSLAVTGIVPGEKDLDNKRYNVNFKSSDFFKIYNQLLNDPALIEFAKSHGYRIVYLLHPVLSAQLRDFNQNDYVEMIQGSDVDYEEILCDASVMITDYSGVQFDFAYMRKPVIYYHPAELPPHYETGVFSYDKMGFGPICTNHEEVVDAICKSVEKECKMEEKYVKRANDFFAYDDHKNCERIFNAIKKYQV